jgi:flagellar basal-body rod modification protein FlgD
MASAVTNTATTVASNANTTVDGNPKSKLGSQDFMKLLLTELKYQDPTAPMDTDKMLSQTSQLSALEAQTATKDAMTAMTAAFQASAGYSMASSIGRLANTGKDTVTLTDGIAASFDAYIPTNSAQASIIIKDGSGNLVKSNDFQNVSQGVITTTWDGTNAAGVKQPDGDYNVSIVYYDTNGAAQTSKISTQPITAIRFTTAGNPELKVGSTYMPASSIKEIF